MHIDTDSQNVKANQNFFSVNMVKIAWASLVK